jgi:hypothetical protein
MHTRTYVLMELSPAAYAEIQQKMLDAGYQHAIDDREHHIDMHGIAVTPKDDVIMVKVGGVPYETVMIAGVQRFKVNEVVRHLCDTKQIDLNKLAIEYDDKKFSQRAYAEFNMALGYSVCGFADLSAFKDMEIENPLWSKS